MFILVGFFFVSVGEGLVGFPGPLTETCATLQVSVSGPDLRYAEMLDF
jgi:hypothetical protein